MSILKGLTCKIGLLHVECLLPQIVCLLLIPVKQRNESHTMNKLHYRTCFVDPYYGQGKTRLEEDAV
jgi:hypothetical protein